MTTPFEDAFERAGFGRDAVLFLTAYARLLNNGGSRQQADDLLDYADRHNLPGRGHSSHAEGHSSPAPSRQPNGEAGGQSSHADEGLVKSAPASPPSGDGEGHLAFAHRGQSGNAPSSPPYGGEGGHALGADEGQRRISSPPSPQHAGQISFAGKAVVDVPASGAGAGRAAVSDTDNRTMPAPRPQSASDKAAMKAVMSAHGMKSIFDTVVGGTGMKLGDFTQYRLKQEKRRLVRDTCLVDLMLDTLDWPDEDKTRIRDFASVEQLQGLYEKSFKALEAMNAA